MLAPGQTGQQRPSISTCPFVLPSVRYVTGERNILKTNVSIYMQITTSVLWGKGTKRSTIKGMKLSNLGVRESTAKVT